MPLDDTNWPTTEVDETTALLIRARGFIARGWCRWAQAKDADADIVRPTSERAVAWCAFGALIAGGMPDAGVLDTSFMHHPAYLRLNAAIDGQPIGSFNNRQETVEPILAAFDRAIAAGRTEG